MCKRSSTVICKVISGAKDMETTIPYTSGGGKRRDFDNLSEYFTLFLYYNFQM